MDNQHTFLQHRRQQEQDHFARIGNEKLDPLHSLLTIEINTTELCNRTCVFCPRHDPEVFPNRNLQMTPLGASMIASELMVNNYKGKISFSGFGENLLNPKFHDIIQVFSKTLPDNIIECNTNGDRLTSDYAHALFDKGLTLLYINLYDGPEQIEQFDKIMQDIPEDKYKYRMHWSNAEDFDLILNNRSGTIDWLGIDDEEVEVLKGTPCYYPFYKMFVDWNGDVIFCSNDWGREHIVGNIISDGLRDVWFSKNMTKIRKRLAKGDRSQSPCNKCNIKGTLFGEQSFNLITSSKEYL